MFEIESMFVLNRVKIFGSLKRLRGFALWGWTNVTQRHLICDLFAEGAIFTFGKLL